jgi:multidrug efflux pump
MMIPIFYITVRRLLGDKLDEVSHNMPHPGEDFDGDQGQPHADQGPAGAGPTGEGAPA